MSFKPDEYIKAKTVGEVTALLKEHGEGEASLDKNPSPAEEEVREGIASNISRCTGYIKIV